MNRSFANRPKHQYILLAQTAEKLSRHPEISECMQQMALFLYSTQAKVSYSVFLFDWGTTVVSCQSNFTSLGRRRNDGKTRRELKCPSSWKDEEAALHPHHRFFAAFSCWKLRCFALSLRRPSESVHSSAS